MGDAYTERTSLAKGAKDLAKEAKRHAAKKVNKVVDRASDEYTQRSYSRFQNEDDEDDDNYYYRQDGGYMGGANEDEGSSDATEGHDDEDEIYEGEYQGIPAGGQAQGNQVAMGKLVSDGQKDRKELETERQADEEELAQQYELIIQECGHGRFQWQLFLVLGLALMSDGVEVFVVGFVLPSAETDMCIPDSGAGWLEIIPESHPSFSPLTEPPEYPVHAETESFPALITQSIYKNGSGDNNTSVFPAGWPNDKELENFVAEWRQYRTGSMTTAVIPSIYILVFIISLPLNAAAIFMFSRRVRPIKPAVIYMLNLATADLLFVLLLPFKASYHYNGNDWILGSAMCSVVIFGFYCNMYCSVLLITCISADRFLAVVCPIRSLTWRSQRHAVVVCCTMWLLAVLGVMPNLLFRRTLTDGQNITLCIDKPLPGNYDVIPVFSCLFFFIPLIITTACYVCIIRALYRRNDSKHSKKTQAVVMAVTVLTVFVICFTPFNVLLVIGISQYNLQYLKAYQISMSFGSVNCCLDPIIYYFGSSQCRKKVAQILSCRVPAETTQAQ